MVNKINDKLTEQINKEELIIKIKLEDTCELLLLVNYKDVLDVKSNIYEVIKNISDKELIIDKIEYELKPNYTNKEDCEILINIKGRTFNMSTQELELKKLLKLIPENYDFEWFCEELGLVLECETDRSLQIFVKGVHANEKTPEQIKNILKLEAFNLVYEMQELPIISKDFIRYKSRVNNFKIRANKLNIKPELFQFYEERL